MSPERISSVGSRERRIAAFADEIRADAANALHLDPDDTTAAAYARLRELAAQVHACVDGRSPAQLVDVFAADPAPRTPLLGVALVFNDQRHGVMLLSNDNGAGVSHRMVPASSDHETTARELARDVIPEDEVVPLSHGVCDSISAGLAMPHTFFMVYAVDVTLVDAGGLDGTLVKASDMDEAEFDPLTRFLLGGAARDVLDSPFALTPDTRSLVAEIRDCARAVPSPDARLVHIAQTAQLLADGTDSALPLSPGDFAYVDARTPSVGAEGIVLDHEERMLLWRAKGQSEWSIPGGRCEVGESSAATVVREVEEHFDIDVEIAGLAGVFDNRLMGATGPDYDVCFTYVGRVRRAPTSSSEDADYETRWCPLSMLGDVALVPGQQDKIGAALQAVSG